MPNEVKSIAISGNKIKNFTEKAIEKDYLLSIAAVLI